MLKVKEEEFLILAVMMFVNDPIHLAMDNYIQKLRDQKLKDEDTDMSIT